MKVTKIHPEGFILKEEWILVSIVSLVAVTLAMTPVFYGWIKTPSGMTLGAVGRDDEYAHLQYASQAKEGGWLFKNAYTLEPTPAIFSLLADLIIGKISALFHLKIVLAYNLGRIIYGLGLLLSLYFFISYLLGSFYLRFLAFLLVCFSSGLGWLWFFPRLLPSFYPHLAFANYVTEAITFPSILFYPHYTFSLTLLVFCFYFFLRACLENSRRFLILSGIFGSFVIQNQPFQAVTLVVVPAVYLFFKQKMVKKDWIYYFAFLFLISFQALYFVVVSQLNPTYQEWTRIKQLSPALPDILLAYGFLVFFAFLGGIQSLEGRCFGLATEKLKFLVCWAGVGLFLVKLPFSFQKRLIMGVHIPLSILGGVGIASIIGIGAKKRNFLVGLLLVLLTVPQNFYFVFDRIRQIRENPSVFFISKKKLESLSWLRSNTKNFEVVLANPAMGLVIPVISGNRVFFGHWGAKTEERAAQLSIFYDTKTPDEARIQFLLTNRVDFLYFDKEGVRFNAWVYGVENYEKIGLEDKERQFNPQGKDYLRLVFENEAASLFKVHLGLHGLHTFQVE